MINIKHLSNKSQEIFKYATTGEFVNKSPGRVTEILIALEGLDRLDAIRVKLDEQGLFVKSDRSGLTHINPLVRSEERQRKFLMKMWRKLGLYRGKIEPFPRLI